MCQQKNHNNPVRRFRIMPKASGSDNIGKKIALKTYKMENQNKQDHQEMIADANKGFVFTAELKKEDRIQELEKRVAKLEEDFATIENYTPKVLEKRLVEMIKSLKPSL